MTDGFWQSLKLDVHIHSYKSDAWGQHNGSTSTHVLCECEYMCVQAGAHRQVGRHVSNKVQQYAGIYLLQNHSTCFGCPSHPSSGVLKIVTTASGTGHSIWVTTFLQRDLIRTVKKCTFLRETRKLCYIMVGICCIMFLYIGRVDFCMNLFTTS
jgi:hypothetical protein